DNTCFPVECWSYPIIKNGKIIGSVVTFTDISERIEAKEKLQQSEAWFRKIFEEGPIGMVITDEHLKFTKANAAFCQMLNYNESELLQMNIKDISYADDMSENKNLIQKALDRKISFYQMEKRYIRKDGQLVYGNLAVSFLRNDAGKITNFLATIEDITDRKQTENRLKKAMDMANAANLAKSAFLANMSHELRTPLNGILGYAQIMERDKNLPEKYKAGINIIQNSGQYLLTLISDILDLSKIEADRIELYPTDFHFEDFLQSIIDIFQIRTKQKNISFIYEKLSHLPVAIHADEKRLRQILINLLSNAVKFTDKGGVSFKIGYHNDKIRFQIEDTGIGINKQDMDKIFTPFQQVGDQSLQTEGTGLGLSITKKLTEIMGDELNVESKFGKGTTFWLALDLPEVTGFEKIVVQKEPTIIGFKGESHKVLIVDDKEANRLVLMNLLAPLGFEVFEAENGHECINIALEEKPALILTDLVMPVMDGFEATRQIRKIPEVKDIVIIMISASVFDCYKQKSMEAGCDDFLPKPIRAEDLLKQLGKHLKLSWIFDNEDKLPNKTKIIPETKELIGPSKQQAEILFDLAMKGNLGKVTKQMDEFVKENKGLEYFAEKLHELAKNFDEEEICDLIESYIGQ
ncbi:PAS domain S-box protein, partial [Thiotrichales bacterium HSG1]|nr:PAS domain S-box protein [Thiotrichales bacterium HSG1]